MNWLKEQSKKLKCDIPAIYIALKDNSTPFFAKLAAAVTIAYALSPIDLIPDFIPVLGCLDDLIVLPALAALTIRLIPKEKLDECRKKLRCFGRMESRRNGTMLFLSCLCGY